MKKGICFTGFLLCTLVLFGQAGTTHLIEIPGGEVLLDGEIHTVDPFRISATEMSADKAATLLNWALERGDFFYPPNRRGQLRLKRSGRILLDLSHKSSPLLYTNRKISIKADLNQYPIVCLSRFGAMLLCNLLSEMENLQPCYDLETGKCFWNRNGYRLPTRAEWQRAYNLNKGSSPREDISREAIYFGNFFMPGHSGLEDNYTHRTGSLQPGAFGLYDLLGNAAEWCWDAEWPTAVPPGKNPRGPETGSRYYIMGGSWESSPLFMGKSSPEEFEDPWRISSRIGLRLVRNAPRTNP